MPDAGFHDDGSGRWEWWHKRPRPDFPLGADNVISEAKRIAQGWTPPGGAG